MFFATPPTRLAVQFHWITPSPQYQSLGEKAEWAVPCISTSARRIPGNVFGHLVATAEDRSRVWFVGKRGWSKIAEEVDLTTYKVAHESKFLSENVVLYSLERKPKYCFLFDRARSSQVKKVARSIHDRLALEPATIDAGNPTARASAGTA